MKRLDDHECAEAISRARACPSCTTLLYEERYATCDASYDFWDEVDGNYHYDDPNPERYKCFESQILMTAEEIVGTIYSRSISIDVDHNFKRNESESFLAFRTIQITPLRKSV